MCVCVWWGGGGGEAGGSELPTSHTSPPWFLLPSIVVSVPLFAIFILQNIYTMLHFVSPSSAIHILLPLKTLPLLFLQALPPPVLLCIIVTNTVFTRLSAALE